MLKALHSKFKAERGCKVGVAISAVEAHCPLIYILHAPDVNCAISTKITD